MSDSIHHHFDKLNRLPPYILAEVIDLMKSARRAGEDIIDLGMGNPDLPTPPHVVEKIVEAARNPRNHRYSASKGIPNLRAAACEWYQRNHGVELDPDHEAIAVIGAKEGLSHFVLMTIGPGDVVLCPDPAYPIHQYSVIIAGGDLRNVPLSPDTDFIANLEQEISRTWPKPKMLILSFPHNPTTCVVDRAFFERIVDFAKQHDLMILHDFAYAEVCFDGYKPPSILEVPGARDVAIEFLSLSKSHSMAGWRVGFAAGNREMIHALGRIKSYLDYGMPQAIQIGAIVALRGPQDVVTENPGDLSRASRHPDRRARRARGRLLEDREAPRNDVRVGPDSRAVPRPRVDGVLETLDSRGQGRGVPRPGIRTARRGLRAIRAGGEQAPDSPGGARNPPLPARSDGLGTGSSEGACPSSKWASG